MKPTCSTHILRHKKKPMNPRDFETLISTKQLQLIGFNEKTVSYIEAVNSPKSKWSNFKNADMSNL